jgi:hypothetical protein
MKWMMGNRWVNMTKISKIIKDISTPIVLILISVVVFMFSEIVISSPGIAPSGLVGWKFIFGFQASIGSVEYSTNSVTGFGLSFVLLLIPIFSLAGIILLILELFDIVFPYSRLVIFILFLLVGILCFLPIQFANYNRVVEDSFRFIRLDSSDLYLYFGGYISGLLALISAIMVGYNIIIPKK